MDSKLKSGRETCLLLSVVPLMHNTNYLVPGRKSAFWSRREGRERKDGKM